MLITDRLTLVSKAAIDIGTMYTYLSRIAHFLLSHERSLLSSLEMNKIHNDYCSVYQMRLSEDQVVSNLIKANILCKEGDSLRFKYSGLFCYCVARYYFENLQQDDKDCLRNELDQMTDRLAYEDYTNIIMFYLYLSPRDSHTIDRLLGNASKIYAECLPANLQDDATFVNRLMKEKPAELIMSSPDITANRDEYRRKQDVIGDEDKNQALAAPDNRVPYSETAHEFTRLAIGLQTLRVMGQVLRSFPGVLPGVQKVELAEASYLLGLRILRRVLSLVESQMQDLRVGFAELFRERHPLSTEGDLAKNADQMVIWLAGAAAYGVIKRICKSVGLQDLEMTFDTVGEKLGQSNAVRLIHLSILLEYFRDTPKSQIYELEKQLERNFLGYKVLRDLVSEFLYFRNMDYRFSQEMGKLFDIAVSEPEYMLNKAVGVGAPNRMLSE